MEKIIELNNTAFSCTDDLDGMETMLENAIRLCKGYFPTELIALGILYSNLGRTYRLICEDVKTAYLDNKGVQKEFKTSRKYYGLARAYYTKSKHAEGLFRVSLDEIIMHYEFGKYAELQTLIETFIRDNGKAPEILAQILGVLLRINRHHE